MPRRGMYINTYINVTPVIYMGFLERVNPLITGVN